MGSKRSTVSFMVALVCADLAYRLLPLGAVMGIMALAMVAAGVMKLSDLGNVVVQEIGLGFSLGIVASVVIKLLVFHVFS